MLSSNIFVLCVLQIRLQAWPRELGFGITASPVVTELCDLAGLHNVTVKLSGNRSNIRNLVQVGATLRVQGWAGLSGFRGGRTLRFYNGRDCQGLGGAGLSGFWARNGVEVCGLATTQQRPSCHSWCRWARLAGWHVKTVGSSAT